MLENQPVAPERTASTFAIRMAVMPKLSDEDVMERLHQGDPDALPILFLRYHRLVLKIALRILRDAGEAEDLMQDVFLEIFRKAGQFDPTKGTAKTWIFQYAYHRSLSRRQYLALRKFYDRHQITEIELAECISLDTVCRGLTMPEWKHVIAQGLATLSEKQRKTIELTCFQGLLLSEVAEHTNESLGNVRHNYYRGLQALRKFIQARRDAGGDI